MAARCRDAVRGIAAALAALLAAPAAAGAIDVPRGTLAEAVAVLGANAGASISVVDARLWQRQVPAVQGARSVGEALRRLLGPDVQITALGGQAWRIAAAPAAARAAPVRAAMVAAPVEDAPIVVTASKRDVPLTRFQGAATVLSGVDLTFGGERGTDAILSRLATVSSTHLGAGRNKLFIRGIADSSFTGPTQATVGQYFGDIRLSYNAPDPDLRLYDIASVEVLEGPQATLYGAGSLGGIIRIVRNPARPGVTEASLSAGVSATTHGDPGVDIGGMVNLRIGATAALRIVGYGISDGGYIDDPRRGLDDINRTRIHGGRATLRLENDDGGTIDFGVTAQSIAGADSQYADRGGPPLSHESRFAQGFDARYGLADVVVAREWDDLRLLSSTGIAGQRLTEAFDASREDGPDRIFTQANHTLLIANETRLWRPLADGFGWVAGASLLYNRTRLTRALGPPGAPLPVTGVTNSIGEATLFGEASFEPLQGLTVTGGGRLTHARLSGTGEDIAPAIAAARAGITADRTETRLLPSFAVSSTAVPGIILYGRMQQGFRPGGLAIDGDFVRRFRNDRVTTLEIGARHGTAGRDRFDLAVSLSATRWRDIQADFVDAGGLPTTANIGDGQIYSLAVSGGWRPVEGLHLDFGLTVNDSRVTDPAPQFVTVFATGRMSQIPNVARYAARAGIDYRAPLSDRIDLHVAANGQYIGSSRLGIGPVLGAAQGDYFDSSLTARLGWTGFGVTFGITNLADTIGNRFALGTPFVDSGDGQITPLRPRTFRIGIDTRF
ncbi:TonB-dependent receptor [Sandarakinorhabdus sp. DWP1-3-1]|uniref:TonB-dependent receptor n=1 Tax=Sandarakinorhabdus sp. DWP1-3-1 TaxID=2804627 RepID=UPI003CF55AF3